MTERSSVHIMTSILDEMTLHELMSMANKIGSRIELCGTPLEQCFQSVVRLSDKSTR